MGGGSPVMDAREDAGDDAGAAGGGFHPSGSPIFGSYIPSLYPSYTTVTTPSPISNQSFINNYSLLSTNYYNSYGFENTSYSGYYHNSNYSVSPSAQVSNTSTFEPSAATYTLLQKREIDLTMTEMAIPIFDGTGDGYWWILCIERYFKARGTPEAAKVLEAVTGLQGSALQWWLEKHHHSKLSWESFTAVFLWWFKPEYRDVLPILEDDKEEVNNNKSLCLSFQPHTTVTHNSKEHGGDEKEPESEGVEEEESEEQSDDEEEKPNSELKSFPTVQDSKTCSHSYIETFFAEFSRSLPSKKPVWSPAAINIAAVFHKWPHLSPPPLDLDHIFMSRSHPSNDSTILVLLDKANRNEPPRTRYWTC